jgi:hypothetical protein
MVADSLRWPCVQHKYWQIFSFTATPVVCLREMRELDGRWRDSVDCGSRLPCDFPAGTPASAVDLWIFAMRMYRY